MNAYENSPRADAGPRKARVEIIPLIDVIFFLLATFVLFTLSLQRIVSVEADFARTSTEPSGDESGLTIQATAEGTFAWVHPLAGTEVIAPAELAPRLAEYCRSTPRPRVAIRGEGGAKLGAVVLAIDQVRAAGIKDYAVETTFASPHR